MSQSNDPNNLKDQSSVDNHDEPIKNPNEPHRPEKKAHKLTALQSGLIGGAVAAVLISGVGYAVTSANDTEDQISTEEVQSIVDEAVSSAQAANTTSSVQSTSLDVTTDVSETVANVQDSVVSVVNMTESVSTYDLFGFTSPTQESSATDATELETSSEGSGVVYKVDGDSAYVVTNNHVIDGADAINIIMSDGTQVEAEVVGSDPWTDLAVLKISSDVVTTVAEFGDSESLKVGEPAIAIGSPLGSEYATTVTQGIISGLDRSVPIDIDGDGTSDWVANVLQTDAAINPGNSGGALLNAAGQVIGINSMKVSSDQVEGMGFAIPAAEVQTIISELEANGEIVRPELGVSMVDLNRVSLDYQSQKLQLPDDVDGGVYVAEVSTGSAAEAAGLQADDVIVEFSGEPVTDSASLRQALYQQKSDASVEVSFYRNGELKTATVQLQPQDKGSAA